MFKNDKGIFNDKLKFNRFKRYRKLKFWSQNPIFLKLKLGIKLNKVEKKN